VRGRYKSPFLRTDAARLLAGGKASVWKQLKGGNFEDMVCVMLPWYADAIPSVNLDSLWEDFYSQAYHGIEVSMPPVETSD
jgi:hypothetical protein